MEDGLGVDEFFDERKGDEVVLILVLVEDGLGANIMDFEPNQFYKS